MRSSIHFFLLSLILFFINVIVAKAQTDKEKVDLFIKKAKGFQISSWDSAFYYASIGYEMSIDKDYPYGAGISKLIISNSKKVSKQRVETYLARV